MRPGRTRARRLQAVMRFFRRVRITPTGDFFRIDCPQTDPTQLSSSPSKEGTAAQDYGKNELCCDWVPSPRMAGRRMRETLLDRDGRWLHGNGRIQINKSREG